MYGSVQSSHPLVEHDVRVLVAVSGPHKVSHAALVVAADRQLLVRPDRKLYVYTSIYIHYPGLLLHTELMVSLFIRCTMRCEIWAQPAELPSRQFSW